MDTVDLTFEIVITGIGLASPIGLDLESAFASLLRGHAAASGAVPPYELAGLRVPKNQKYLSPPARHLMWAGLQAVERSGWTRDSLTPDRTAVFTASGQVGLEPSLLFPAFKTAHTADGLPDWAATGGPAARSLDAYFPLRALANSGLALLTMELGARGPANNFVQSDTAGVWAVEAAIGALQEGLCDVAICGAFESLLTPANELNYRRMGLVSASGAMRPFDRAADGITLAEGAAVLVLERRADAQARGARVCARIAVDSGGPVDFVVAAGHAVPAMDLAESDAAHACPVKSVTAFKGATGYLGAATALVEVALATAALHAKIVPAVVGLAATAEGIRLPLVQGESRVIEIAVGSARCLTRSWVGERGAIRVDVL